MCEEARRISEATAIKSFALAGNATFTIVSSATGARFTFKIQAKKGVTGFFFVSVLNGSNNEADYAYMGIIIAGPAGCSFKRGAKSTIDPDAASMKAFAWFFENLRRAYVSPTVEFWHEGRCGRCGRKLTVPSSIETGLGPECAEKVEC